MGLTDFLFSRARLERPTVSSPLLDAAGSGSGGSRPASEVAIERIRAAQDEKASHLDLTGLGLSELPDEITELQHLASLTLDNNQFERAPAALRNLPGLIDISLRKNKLVEATTWLFRRPHLRRLSLSGNQLTSLPKVIHAPGLVCLDVADNRISALPKSLEDFDSLRELNCAGNPLTTLPLRWPPRLGSLNIGSLQLKILPTSLLAAPGLYALGLSYNSLEHLPDWLADLTELQELFVAGCPLGPLRSSLRHLRQLRVLELSGTRIGTLPPWIGELQQLKVLHVARCGLKNLPESLGELAHLRDLSVANIGFICETGPDSMHLDRAGRYSTPNDLRALPTSLQRLGSLEALYLHGNGSLRLPEEVLGPTALVVRTKGAKPAPPAEILSYYLKLDSGRLPLNEAKLIFVGRGGVGKTSLVTRLARDEFNPTQAKTEGIQITHWSVSPRETESVRLHIWDFGGQEILHATHQFFLTHRSLYVLVLCGRGGGYEADVEYWLRLIQSFGTDSSGDESPVIVVLNKIAEHRFQLDQRGLKSKYPCIRGFIETDCRDGIGIDILRKAISRETDQLKHLRDAFPAPWFAIKNRLSQMQENYLTFDRFREICVEHGEPSPVAQDQLASYLNALGIALNFRDDPRLRELHILNPHWVTEGIYQILNSPALARKHGVLAISELTEVLNPTRFPPPMHQFLMDLMRKFELCFPFPDNESRYLIPELLGAEQPDLSDISPEEGLRFRYLYEVLPEGILPRFIVRTHALSVDLPQWRNGVVLEFDGNRAIVRADLQDRRVDVEVYGPAQGRRRLLAVIRSNLEHIHRSIERLDPIEMVPLPKHPKAAVPYAKLVTFEAAGIESFLEVIDGSVIQVDVRELLDGIDLGGTRPPSRTVEAEDASLRVFISYSHRDEQFRGELETHLTLLNRQRIISVWSDRRILPGESWERSIDDALETADIVLVLVSADFMASNFCYEEELSRAIERHRIGEARVIPIIVRDVDWRSAPIGQFQMLPRDARPVSLWENRDSAWRNVAEGIAAVAEELRVRRRAERGR